MNTDSIQNNLLTSAAKTDSTFTIQDDSLTLISDTLNPEPQKAEPPKRFFTEKKILKELPDNSSISLVPSWITFTLLMAFVLLAILNFLHHKSLVQIIRSTLGLKQTNLLLREGKPMGKQSTYLLSMIYIVTIPLLFYATINRYIKMELGTFEGIKLFFVIILFLIGFFVYKLIFIRITSVLFQTQKRSSELIQNILIFNLTIGVLILPLITLFIYSQQIIILQIAIGVYLIGIVLRIFREIQIGLSKSIFSILHLFLYLCTLEFIPAVIVAKIILNFYMY